MRQPKVDLRGWTVVVRGRKIPVLVFRSRADLRAHSTSNANAATVCRAGRSPVVLLYVGTSVGALAHEAQHVMEDLLTSKMSDEDRATMVGRFTESLASCITKAKREWGMGK